VYYDKNVEPIDLMMWSNLFSDPVYQRLANTMITSAADLSVSFNVSTIWLGTDMSFGQYFAPIIFETMVFGNDAMDHLCNRYPTEESAMAGHESIVTVVAATIDDPLIMDALDHTWEIMVARATGDTP
jgi:hypothetical protein